jgi:hypothetical protein
MERSCITYNSVRYNQNGKVTENAMDRHVERIGRKECIYVTGGKTRRNEKSSGKKT